MSVKYLDARAKELKQGKNIFCRGEIAKALREVKYRHDHEMYGAASKAIEDLEFLVSRIPACNPNSKLKQGSLTHSRSAGLRWGSVARFQIAWGLVGWRGL